MNALKTYIVTVIERTRHTLSVEACSVEAVVELLNDSNNPSITPVDKALLDLHIAEIRGLSGANSYHGKEVRQ